MSDVGVVDCLDAGIDCVCFICYHLFIFGGCGDCNVVELELLLRRSWSLERHHHVHVDFLLLEDFLKKVWTLLVFGRFLSRCDAMMPLRTVWSRMLMGCLTVQEYP